MKILVTGASGFVGLNLTENLKNIRDHKNQTRPGIVIDEIYEYDIDNTEEDLDRFCSDCDFVFNLAGVNRPVNKEDFVKGNVDFSSKLLNLLEKHNNKATVMLSSSVQATLSGRFGTSEYGLSKKAGEELFFEYGKKTGAKVLVYRFPNIVGKWARPNYNSAIATFCHNIARDLPITVNDPSTELEILFIDDLVEEMFDALEGREHHCEFDGVNAILTENGKYCASPVTHKATLGYTVDCLRKFREQPDTLMMPEIAKGSFEKKLYTTYLSYLPEDKIIFPLTMHKDNRGSFTEILKTEKCGQFSVNIIKPGITKGMHWHNAKWEFFIVVSGKGLIEERMIHSDTVHSFTVTGEDIQAIHILPGYTHTIKNLSDSDDLVTVMWANEPFDKEHPDTFSEPV